MNARPFESRDWPTVSQWFVSHGWDPEQVKAVAPDEGWIVEDDAGTPLAAAWVYFHAVKPVCWLEWVVTNPASNLRGRPLAIRYLLGHIKEQARDFGVKVIISALRSRALIRLFEEEGAVVADTGMTHMIMRL